MPKRDYATALREQRERRTSRARDKVCPGCGGMGGAHTRLDCAWWKDEFARQLPARTEEHK